MSQIHKKLFSSYQDQVHHENVQNLMRIGIFVLTIYITARELYQFSLSPLRYLKSLENYLDCALIVFLTLILFDIYLGSWRPTVAATSILLISVEVFLLAGSLPFWSYSTYYIMLKTVTWSFLKSLSLYAIVLLTLSFTMFALQQAPPVNQQIVLSTSERCNDKNVLSSNGSDGNRKNLNLLSLIKGTLDMLNGQIDEKSQNFKTDDSRYYFCHILLLLVTMVVSNLFRGLAVSDTQAIKSESELTKAIRRAQVLMRYKRVFSRRY